MRLKRSSRRRHRSSRGREEEGPRLRPDTLFTLCALAIALAAAIPLGGAGFFATQLVAAACVIAGVIGGAVLRAPPGGPVWESKPLRPPQATLTEAGPARQPPDATRWAGRCVLALAAWCAIQMIRWPASWLAWTWRGDAGLYREVASDAGGRISLAMDRFVSLHTILLWLGLGLLAWACSRQMRSGRRVSLALHGLALIGFFQVIYGIFLAGSLGRLRGTFGNPDALGGLLALTLPATLGLLFSRFKGYTVRGRVGWRRLFYRLGSDKNEWRLPWLLFVLAVQTLGLFFTGSRGAFLSAAAACGALLAWYGLERPKALRAIAAAGALWAALVLLFSARGLDQHLLDRTVGDSADLQQAKAARVEVWKSAIRLCRTFPMGVGPGGTVLALPLFQTETYGRYRLDYAHNDYLQFLGDLGLPGFALLLLLLGLVLGRGARATRKDHEGDGGSIWLRRGALLAVLAGLLHALVEFNLSARPGGQAPFFMLCGILWGAGARKIGSDNNADLSPPRRSWRRVRSAAAILAGAFAVCLAGTGAWAWFLRESAAASVGLIPDDYLWFRCRPVPADQALETMIRASRRAPWSSLLRRSVAETRLSLHQMRLQEAARGILALPGRASVTDLPLEAANPDHQRALRLAGLALGLEEAQALQDACEDAEAALRLAPWDARSRLLRGGILLREAALNIGADGASERGWRDLENAMRLYPVNAGAMRQACFELARSVGRQGSAADRERIVTALIAWGSRALAIDPSSVDAIMDAWWTARIPLSRVLALPDAPVALLWRMYELLEGQGDAADARLCLDALKPRIEDARPPKESAVWTQRNRNRWTIHHTQNRVRWAREHVKHLLRHGDWAGLQAFKAERQEAWRTRMRVEMDRLDLAGPASPSLRRLRLRELDAAGGLDPELTIEWVLLELDAGLSAAAVQDPLAELVLTPGSEGVNLARLAPWRGFLSDTPLLAGLLTAREAEISGRWDAAAAALAELAGANQAPLRLAHRILLWQARMLEAAGRGPESLAVLRQAAQACPADPDVAAALAAAGGSDPAASRTPNGDAPPLDIGFMGRRMVLDRAYLDEHPSWKGGMVLNLVWRFWGRLPSNLQILVGAHDPDDLSLFQKTISPGAEKDADFSGGRPPFGSAWTLAVPLPPRAAKGRLIQVTLKSGAQILLSEDGLNRLDLAMDKLPRGKSKGR